MHFDIQTYDEVMSKFGIQYLPRITGHALSLINYFSRNKKGADQSGQPQPLFKDHLVGMELPIDLYSLDTQTSC